MKDPDQNLHVAEYRLRLKPADAKLVQAMAERTNLKPAVLLRCIVLAAIERAEWHVTRIPDLAQKRSAA